MIVTYYIYYTIHYRTWNHRYIIISLREVYLRALCIFL